MMSRFYRDCASFNTINRRRWIEKQARLISKLARVLDAGAGRGQYREFFAHCFYETQDFGKEIGTQGQYAKLDYTCDITDISVPDETFDVVLCTEVLEHLPEPIRAVKELARILKPGGKFLLTAPLGSYLHQEPYHFYGGFTPHWYNKVLQEYGFKIINIERNMGFFSLFGGETIRFVQYLNPTNIRKVNPFSLHFILFFGWLLMWPLSRLLIIVAPLLDSLFLETANFATVGYHVAAVKQRDKCYVPE